jgi:hypothetical protein
MPLRLCWIVGVLVPLCADPLAAQTPHEVVRVSQPEEKNPKEVSVAINPANPDHIVAVAHQGATLQAPSSNYVYVSTDGGRVWRTQPAPNPDRRGQGDDAIAFSADGIAHHTYIAFEGLRNPKPARASTGIFTSASRDGLLWNSPVAIVDHVNTLEPFEDKPWLAIDTSADSPHKGNIYVAWTRFDVYGSKDPAHKSHIYYSRSVDGGRTFAPVRRISAEPGGAVDDSNTVEGAMPAVGPKGEVYIAWAGPKGIVFTQSRDGGKTFPKERKIMDTPDGWDLPVPGVPRHNGMPITGVDRSRGKHRGAIYICWIDKRHGDADVFVMSSRDGGANWTEPVRVNDDPKGNGKDQLFAWMAVDPIDGAVNVIFYDRRDQEDTKLGLTMARSVDGGRTFVNHHVEQKPFAPEKLFLGDYIGIDAFGGRVVALYCHVVGKRQTALSAAVFRFQPGTQEAMVRKDREK